jgi:hypothetical protein
LRQTTQVTPNMESESTLPKTETGEDYPPQDVETGGNGECEESTMQAQFNVAAAMMTDVEKTVKKATGEFRKLLSKLLTRWSFVSAKIL